MNLTKDFWNNAYKENASRLIGVCRRYVGDSYLAEDLAHDAFLTAMNKQESFTGKGAFEAWLRKIAINTALMYLRNKKTEQIINDWMQHENEYQAHDDQFDHTWRNVVEQADFSSNELLEIIDLLPEHHRQVFNLYVIDKYSHSDIGSELNISVGTSKSHLARARKKIQQLLYEKALKKPEEQKKKKSAGILLLFLSGRQGYIDKVFRERLGDLRIEPLASEPVFRSADLSAITRPEIRTSFLASKGRYLFIGVSGGIIIAFFLVSTFRNNKDTTIPIIAEPANTSFQDTLLHPEGSSVESTKPELPPSKKASGISTTEPAPVIIKRTIVQRKTVTIHDTIRLSDTTHVK